jgi:CO/xanthine dehydrogenase FAD-binding subunit
VPLRGRAAEALLTGTPGDDASIEAAVATCDDIEALGDFHGSADYRKSVARSILRKVLKSAIARAKGGSVH